MDVDTDSLMGEVEILPSTESNDLPQTIDPAVFYEQDIALKDHVSAGPDQTLSLPDVNPPTFTSPTDMARKRKGKTPASNLTPAQDDQGDNMDISTSRSFQHVEVVVPAPTNLILPYSTARSGLIYDVRMRFHSESATARQNDDFHPEDPRRILEIYNELVAAGLAHDRDSPFPSSDSQLLRVSIRPANCADICLVHSPKHYRWVESLSRNEQELAELAETLDSVYLHNRTWFCATLSAGGAIIACKAVVVGHVRNSIAVIRPPGHHAEHEKSAGFCFFNNVCIAARVCQRDYPETCRKILILDWDVHHGNGVQHIFYNDPNVLYISLHVYNNGSFYPGGVGGDHLHCGEGPGKGKNVNIPWPKQGMADGDYIYAFQKVVMPIATEFDPDLVIVSAGFDAAEGDLLGGCFVTPAGYAHMTHMLMSLAKGKIAICLEGGYNLRSIAKSALAVTRTLMGEPPDRLLDSEPSPAGVRTVQIVMKEQSRYWKCMYPKTVGVDLGEQITAERMHDVVRGWQTKVLWEQHKMLPLFILHSKLSQSFKNEVLATQNYREARPLLVIFHDPPEMLGVSDPLTNRIELHDTYLTDVVKTYLDWAIDHHFAIIDVNIPKHRTKHVDEKTVTEAENNLRRIAATRELATYLWQNYIEVGDSTHIFLVGIGEAYSGLVEMLSSNDNSMKAITAIVGFVAENSLQPLRRQPDDSLATRFYKQSLIFVAGNHAAWAPEEARKSRKKYGNLVKSPFDTLTHMIAGHMKDVHELLTDNTEDWRQQREARKAKQVEKRKSSASSQATSSNTAPNAPSSRSEGSSQSHGRFGPFAKKSGAPPVGYFAVPAAKVPQSPKGTPKK